MAGKEYSAEDIRILEGLDAVRLRPGMYIGSTGVKGLHHILWEIVDNAIDEAANGYATRIEVKLYKDGSASVEDNGRGIPTDIHPQTGVSGVEVVFTQLHAGGKFDEHNYSFSGGLHGVGASVTNALSEWLKVEVYRGTVYKMFFRSYFDEATDKMMSGVPEGHLVDTGVKTDKTGTFVHFKPDASVFDTVVFNFEAVSKRLKELAFLNKGLEINLVDERVEEGRPPDLGQLQVRRRPARLLHVPQRGEGAPVPRPDRVQGGEGRHPHRVCHPAHGRVHGEPVLLRQQHPHARGRVPRDGLPHGADQEPQRRRPQPGRLKEKDANLWARTSARG